MNKFSGEVKVLIGNKEGVIQYDWKALAEIQAQCGEDALQKITAGIFDPDTIAGVLAIGFKKHNPEITKDVILDMSPPLVPAVKAIDKAISYSYFGPDADAPPAPSDNKKKTKAERKTK